MRSGTDWYQRIQALLAGDRLALFELGRLVNGLLSRWHAYDFRDEWDDVIQEVALAVATAVRDGRLGPEDAVLPYVAAVARNKFVDRLKRHLRWDGKSLPWDDAIGEREGMAAPGFEGRDLQRALENLPEKTRTALVRVYVEGKTYEEAASATGIPLGSLKRYLREGLTQLRVDLGDSHTPSDPISSED